MKRKSGADSKSGPKPSRLSDASFSEAAQQVFGESSDSALACSLTKGPQFEGTAASALGYTSEGAMFMFTNLSVNERDDEYHENYRFLNVRNSATDLFPLSHHHHIIMVHRLSTGFSNRL